jgi:hypothetical protein
MSGGACTLADAAATPEAFAKHLLELHNGHASSVSTLLHATLGILNPAHVKLERELQHPQPGVREKPSLDAQSLQETSPSGGEISQQLNRIKARTMYNMVEDVGNDKSKKLLFLTTSQADLIASTPQSMQKMLEALDVGKSQLVINLLNSNGSGAWVRTVRPPSQLEMHTAAGGVNNWACGAVGGRSPFLTPQEERDVERRLDNFMADVLIPLAARTNAIVLACALRTECMLTDSFTRMYSVKKSQWGDKAPFKLISLTTDL